MAEFFVCALTADLGAADDLRGVINELGMPPEMAGMAESMFRNPAFVQVP